MGFREKLTQRQKKVKSLVCVGLDPLPEKCPQCLYPSFSEPNLYLPPEIVIRWMREIIDATAPYACMYKLQRAHYESMHFGEIILRAIVKHLKENHPDIPILLDCKRGDIGRTQARYKVAHFELDDVEGITFNPYMGFDCIEALVDEKVKDEGKAIVGVCYTSNPAAREIQDVKLINGQYLWEYIAQKILEWSEKLGISENAGLVMAAAYEFPKDSGKIFSWHLKRARTLVGNKLWFLIPGIGAQGGLVKETVEAAYAGAGSIVINSSSAIIFASDKEDFAEAAAKKAKELRDEINQYLP
ncbi:orotidine-5'-phosphate decarboxylase [bacterium]|nr:orotidine-5'-phosphate decarboxylase [bacterium]